MVRLDKAPKKYYYGTTEGGETLQKKGREWIHNDENDNLHCGDDDG